MGILWSQIVFFTFKTTLLVLPICIGSHVLAKPTLMEFFVNNLKSPFSLTASILFMGIMVSSCAKDFSSPLNNDEIPPPAATPVAAKPTPAPVENTGPLNAVAQAAQKGGVVNCLGRINQVSNFLVAGSQTSGASLTVSPQIPNERMATISFEIKSPQVLSYASADFAPLASTCGATYEAVTHWQNSCKDVAKKGYAQLKFIGAIQSNILVLEGGPQLRVFLMPAGTGCVAIKKEVVY